MIGSSRLLVLRLLLRSLNLLVGLVQALTRVVDEAVSSSSSRSDQVAAKRAMVSTGACQVPTRSLFALPTNHQIEFLNDSTQAHSCGMRSFSSLYRIGFCTHRNFRSPPTIAGSVASPLTIGKTGTA